VCRGRRVLHVQDGLELRRELYGLLRCDAEMQRPRGNVAMCRVPLECGLRRNFARLQHEHECLRATAIVRRTGGDLRPERQRELLRVEFRDWRHERVFLS